MKTIPCLFFTFLTNKFVPLLYRTYFNSFTHSETRRVGSNSARHASSVSAKSHVQPLDRRTDTYNKRTTNTAERYTASPAVHIN